MKIVSPIHCGVAAKPYVRLYKARRVTHSIEHGFKCPVCNQHAIPHESGISAFWASYSLELDRIREAAIAAESKV